MKNLAMVDRSVMYYITLGAKADLELFNTRTDFHNHNTYAVAFCPVNQQLPTLVNECG
jgi:hypothetical protein